MSSNVMAVAVDINIDGIHLQLDAFEISVSHCDPETNHGGCAVPTVPIPAAAWLFGTALIGFIGISRHRKVI